MPKDPTSWNGVYLSALYGPCRYPGFQEYCEQLRAQGITQNMQVKSGIVKRFAGTPQWQEYHQWVAQVYPAARAFGAPPPQKVTGSTTAPIISSAWAPSSAQSVSGFAGDDMISQVPSVPLPIAPTVGTAGKSPTNWNGVYLSKLYGPCQYPGFQDYCNELRAAGITGNMQQKGHVIKRFAATKEWQDYHNWVVSVYPAARAFGTPPPQKVTSATGPGVRPAPSMRPVLPTAPLLPVGPTDNSDLILQSTSVRRQPTTSRRQGSPTRRRSPEQKTLKQRQLAARMEQLPPTPRRYALAPPVPKGARALTEAEKTAGVVRGKRTLRETPRRAPPQLQQEGIQSSRQQRPSSPRAPTAPRLSQVIQASRRQRQGQQSGQESQLPEGF